MQTRRLRISLIVSAAILALGDVVVGFEVQATVWTVRKDGTGDFSTIQDAVNAAGSGDIVDIGPGRFDEAHAVTLASGQTFTTHVEILQNQLTLIGSGDDETIIGQAGPAAKAPATFGILADVGHSLSIAGIRIAHAPTGIYSLGPVFEAENCTFDDTYVQIETETARVVGCTYLRDGMIVEASTQITIESCSFDGLYDAISAISPNTLIRNTHIVNQGGDGIVVRGGSAMIEDCTVYGSGIFGMQVGIDTHASITNCRVGSSVFVGLFAASGSSLDGSGNVFEGGSGYTMYLGGVTAADFRFNHILNTGGYSIYARMGGSPATTSSEPPIALDFTDNYWGSADELEIDGWISDSKDVGTIAPTVLFVPFHTLPVSTRVTSMAELKALFTNAPD